MGWWSTIKTKLTRASHGFTQAQFQELEERCDPRIRFDRIKQELLQQVAAGVVYEATPEDLGHGVANAAVEDMHYFMGCLTHFPPEGVDVESLTQTIGPLLELLAFAVCTYEVTLLPHFHSLEIRGVIATSLRHHALSIAAASLNRATDENFLSTGEAFLDDRLSEYYHILAGKTDHFALLGVEEMRFVEDDWYFRTAAFANATLKNVCSMARQPTLLESIGPTLHRYFKSMEEFIPIQMNMIKLKPSARDVVSLTARE